MMRSSWYDGNQRLLCHDLIVEYQDADRFSMNSTIQGDEREKLVVVILAHTLKACLSTHPSRITGRVLPQAELLESNRSRRAGNHFGTETNNCSIPSMMQRSFNHPAMVRACDKTDEHAVVVVFFIREEKKAPLFGKDQRAAGAPREDMMLIVIADNMIAPIVDCHVECGR